MIAATPNNESLTDAVALIAVCKGSVALMEVALSLQVVASGVTEVPEEARRNRLFARVHRRLTNPAWLATARAALANEGLARVGASFRTACFEYATPKTATPYDDEEWLRAIQLFYLLEENMRVLADMILELMRLPNVDVEPQQAPAMKPRPVAAPVAIPPPAPIAAPRPAPQPRTEPPPAEWAIPIALIAIGKAERNPLWVSFGATVGCLSGFWNHEPKLAEDPQFSVAAKKMLEAPRGFEMASALLHDPVLRAASQAMMMRWYAVTGGNVSSDGLRDAMAADAVLAATVSVVLRATEAVLKAYISRPASSANRVTASGAQRAEVPPTRLPTELSVKPIRVNGPPPKLWLMPIRAPHAAPRSALRERDRVASVPTHHQAPDIVPYFPEQRCRSPPVPGDAERYGTVCRRSLGQTKSFDDVIVPLALRRSFMQRELASCA